MTVFVEANKAQKKSEVFEPLLAQILSSYSQNEYVANFKIGNYIVQLNMSEHLIGYASGIGAGDTGCGDGPAHLTEYNPNFAKNMTLLYPDFSQGKDQKDRIISELCTRLALLTKAYIIRHQLFTVIGGDHSSAIGTWSGVAYALRNKGDLGLIWIDAHLDANTDVTTPSGNIHGMPVAAILGYGNPLLTEILDNKPKIKPENLCMIGMRSYELGEHQLLQELGVKIFYMKDIEEQGLENVFKQALEIVNKNTVAFGVSLDIDAFDPVDAPGVGTPEAEGISAKEMTTILKQQLFQYDENELDEYRKKFCGFEIAEFNPHHDQNFKTQKIIEQLLK